MKEKRLQELKKELRPFNIVSIVNLIVVIVGAVFLIYGLATKKTGGALSDELFCVGIGLFAAAVAANTAGLLANRRAFDEYYRLKREIKHSK